MKTLTLTILASDILNSEYTNGNDCAITRALTRAGRPDLMDDADQIIKIDLIDGERDIVVPHTNKGYQKMQEFVQGMYDTRDSDNPDKKYPIVDMEFTIKY